jgi:mannan endo-1,4-beta-mannosidase
MGKKSGIKSGIKIGLIIGGILVIGLVGCAAGGDSRNGGDSESAAGAGQELPPAQTEESAAEAAKERPVRPPVPERERLPRPARATGAGQGGDSAFLAPVDYPAADAEIYGSLAVMDDGSVGRFEQKDKEDRLAFVIAIEREGFYRLDFLAKTFGGYKENYLFIDDVAAGKFAADSEELAAASVRNVYFTEGPHTVAVTAEWGWIAIQALTVAEEGEADDSIFDIPVRLVNPDADDNALGLMSFLVMNYGLYSLAGQQSQGDWGRDHGLFGGEAQFIYEQTGKRPAVIGLDMIDYSLSRAIMGTRSHEVEAAIEAWENNAIVTFCWHWNAPAPYIDGTWWSAFYTDHSQKGFFKKIMDGKDPEGYQLLLDDIDEIAGQLGRLNDAGVPVLWRPLHEASGGWFWWGTDRESYLKLYKLMFERLHDYHGLTNLIWVWNGQHRDWYPGDEYVDIIGEDIYAGERVYASQVNKFLAAADYTEAPKLVAMTENGCLADPELMNRDGAMWSFWCVWNGDFATTEKYTEFDMLRAVYGSEFVLTHEALPDLKSYPVYVD